MSNLQKSCCYFNLLSNGSNVTILSKQSTKKLIFLPKLKEKTLFTLIFGNILLPAQATTICNSCGLNKLIKSLTDRNVIIENPVAI